MWMIQTSEGRRDGGWNLIHHEAFYDEAIDKTRIMDAFTHAIKTAIDQPVGGQFPPWYLELSQLDNSDGMLFEARLHDGHSLYVKLCRGQMPIQTLDKVSDEIPAYRKMRIGVKQFDEAFRSQMDNIAYRTWINNYITKQSDPWDPIYPWDTP